MPQNDRNSRNRKRRRAYDQARDDRRGGQSTQRRSSTGAGVLREDAMRGKTVVAILPDTGERYLSCL